MSLFACMTISDKTDSNEFVRSFDNLRQDGFIYTKIQSGDWPDTSMLVVIVERTYLCICSDELVRSCDNLSRDTREKQARKRQQHEHKRDGTKTHGQDMGSNQTNKERPLL